MPTRCRATGENCAGNGYGAAQGLRDVEGGTGFRPDIILGHVGWGELTFVRQVWPDVPVIGLFEYFYLARGGMVGFDPEFPASDQAPFTHACPQCRELRQYPDRRSGLCGRPGGSATLSPESFHSKLYVCHDGIRTDVLTPDAGAAVGLGRLERPLTRADEVLTYVARNLEPARGFHIFMRAPARDTGRKAQSPRRPSWVAAGYPMAGPATNPADTAP